MQQRAQSTAPYAACPATHLASELELAAEGLHPLCDLPAIDVSKVEAAQAGNVVRMGNDAALICHSVARVLTAIQVLLEDPGAVGADVNALQAVHTGET